MVLCSMFVCGCLCERERERDTITNQWPLQLKPTALPHKHSLITKHIHLNIKHHHNSQTQKPIYPKIKQIGQQVKLEEGNGFMGREVLGWERSEIGSG